MHVELTNDDSMPMCHCKSVNLEQDDDSIPMCMSNSQDDESS